MRDVKLKWAYKVLKSKYFVVLTDKESAIMFHGIDPTSFEDVLALDAQTNDLQRFIYELNKLALSHRKQLRKLMGQSDTAERQGVPVKKHAGKATKKVPVTRR